MIIRVTKVKKHGGDVKTGGENVTTERVRY